MSAGLYRRGRGGVKRRVPKQEHEARHVGSHRPRVARPPALRAWRVLLQTCSKRLPNFTQSTNVFKLSFDDIIPLFLELNATL